MGILERWKYFTNFTFIPSRNKINKNFRSCRLWRDFWEEKQMNLFTDLVGLAKDTNFTCNSFQLYLKDPFIFFKSNILNKYSRFLGKREKMLFWLLCYVCVIVCIHYLLYMYNIFFISQCSIYSSEESKLCVIYLCCRALDGGRC